MAAKEAGNKANVCGDSDTFCSMAATVASGNAGISSNTASNTRETHNAPHKSMADIVLLNEVPVQGILGVQSFKDALLSSFVGSKKSGTCEDGNGNMGIILTKPPETVGIVRMRKEGTNPEMYYIFDSHSRPQLSVYGAYLLVCNSLDEVVSHLNSLFPIPAVSNRDINYGAVDGIPEEELNMVTLQNAMYNSFELTALTLK